MKIIQSESSSTSTTGFTHRKGTNSPGTHRSFQRDFNVIQGTIATLKLSQSPLPATSGIISSLVDDNKDDDDHDHDDNDNDSKPVADQRTQRKR